MKTKAIASLLPRFKVDAIDIAPKKYFYDPAMASNDAIARVRDYWADNGVEITGMQSLLFGAANLNTSAPRGQNATLQRLSSVCRIAAGLGATRLVFGSFKNRDRTGLSDVEALDMAVPFFERLGEVAQSNGVLICLEPIPGSICANFLTTTAQAARVVAAVNHKAIRMQLDTGTLSVNNEDPGEGRGEILRISSVMFTPASLT